MGDPRLELDGEQVSARLLPERGTNGGYSLVIEGTTQSQSIRSIRSTSSSSTTRLIAAVIDGCREAAAVRVLHLGGGALTVPATSAPPVGLGAARRGAASRTARVRARGAPLTDDVELTVEFDDGRAAVERAARTGGGYDLAIVDVFSGGVSPRHMSTLGSSASSTSSSPRRDRPRQHARDGEARG